MENIESAVAEHYGDTDLLTRIYAGLEAAGIDRDNMKSHDLAPVDEFHIGGREATARVVAKMSLDMNQHILDVGCGIGGAARYIAETFGCAITGIDLTPEFIEAAKTLTERTGLGDKVTYKVASALDMPFEDQSFDAAITLHVAMNIRDRATLYGEIARVLKPGATFCVYDVMKKNEDDLTFPVPWAQSPATSHLTSPEEMHRLLDTAGFEVHEVNDQTETALEFFKQGLTATAAEGPPPLGVHIVMGESAPQKFRNMLSNIENGRIAPVQMTARRFG